MFRKRPPAVSSSSQTTDGPITEKRRYFRASVDIGAEYTVEHRGARTGRIDDLSAGGVRLETDEDIAAGTILRLAFPAGKVAMNPTGRVVMSFFDGGRKRFLHGVAFTAIDPAQQEAIVALVAELQQRGTDGG
ncbi:MAG: hypothetical protein NVS2B17_18150 [Candidatus Velthaea sp.]